MLTVIFVFARCYFVSLKSCPLLFLLLAEVVFFFCEVIAKLILAICYWLGLEHTMEKKSYPSTFLNFSNFVLRITWNLTPPFSPLFKQNWWKIWKRTPRTTCRERLDTFFLVNVSSASMTMSMKTEIRAARALAWRLLGLVTQHSEEGALRDQSK